MADDRNKELNQRIPDDVSIASQSSADASSIGAGDTRVSAFSPDPADEVPVPPAMSPAEIDERAQVVESLRESEGEAGDEARP